MKSKPRLLLGDDHLMFLQGLDRLLSMNHEVVGTAGNGPELLAAAETLDPDVIVMDLNMPHLNGLEASRRLVARRKSWRIIMLTMHADVHIAAAALAAGVDGYLIKDEAFETLERGIQSAMEGRRVVSPMLDQERLRRLLKDFKQHASPVTFDLTGRQKEVLTLLVNGFGLKEVGARLGISIKTVEFHKYAMMERLGVRTSAELVRYGVVLGLSG